MGSITAFAYSCGEKTIRGGLAKLYLLSYCDAAETNGLAYAISEAGDATIKVAVGKNFVNIGLIKRGGLAATEAMTVAENGIFEITQGVTLAVTGVNKKSRKMLNELKGQPVIAILKTKHGNNLAYGLDGQLELSSVTGTIDDTNNGLQIVFDGNTVDFAPEVTDVHLSELLLPAK